MSTPSEIATAATKTKKPTKQDAQVILLAMAGEYNIPAEEAAMLYSYFMPPLPAKPKTVEQWVGLAIGVRDVRYYLNFYYSDGERLVATDGSRIHLTPTKLAEGFYDKSLNPVERQGTYPNIDRLFTDGDHFSIRLADLTIELVKGLHTYHVPNVGYFNKRLLDELCRMNPGEEFLCTSTKDSHKLQFNFDDGRRAVLMGIRA